MRIPRKIQVILDKAKCPHCHRPLIFGGWKNYFQYVELSNLNSGHHVDKDHSDEMNLQCEIASHLVVSVLNEEELDALNKFLIKNIKCFK